MPAGELVGDVEHFAAVLADNFFPRALIAAPWSDEEAGGKFIALSWRLSVDPTGGPKVVREVERLRTDLLSR
jgi:hypothetical protein